MADKRPALGKGLSALIPDAPEPKAATMEVFSAVRAKMKNPSGPEGVG